MKWRTKESYRVDRKNEGPFSEWALHPRVLQASDQRHYVNFAHSVRRFSTSALTIEWLFSEGIRLADELQPFIAVLRLFLVEEIPVRPLTGC